MSDSFRRAACTQPSVSESSAEMQCLNKVAPSTGKMYLQDFQKVAVLKRSTK